jgi:hypothetical protein
MKTLLALAAGFISLSAQPQSTDVRIECRFAPRIDRTERGNAVRYELRVHNGGRRAVRLETFQVRDASDGALLINLADEQIPAALAVGQSRCDVAGRMVAPGGECLLYVDANLGHEAPRMLQNTIAFASETDRGNSKLVLRTVDDVGSPLGPPVGAGNWVAVHYAGWSRGHRRVFYPAGRGMVLPGRFAIDFVKVLPDGTTNCGDADRPADAVGYGDPVLAVADGRIAAVRDRVGEAATISGNGPHDRTAAPGNYVVLALGRGRFATYEHLRPGSIRVRAGERVRRGTELGELGFTGDSTGPHLHFHVSNSAEPLGGEGLPFVFARFSVLGAYSDIAQLGRAGWQTTPMKRVASVRPGENSVVSFRSGASDERSAIARCSVRTRG